MSCVIGNFFNNIIGPLCVYIYASIYLYICIYILKLVIVVNLVINIVITSINRIDLGPACRLTSIKVD